MKHGSLDNMLMGAGQSTVNVTIGQPATIIGWTDRYPAIVTNVNRFKNGKIRSVVVQEVNWKQEPWPSGYAEEIYTDSPCGEPRTFKVVTHGAYKGRIKDLIIGEHDAYRDPQF